MPINSLRITLSCLCVTLLQWRSGWQSVSICPAALWCQDRPKIGPRTVWGPVVSIFLCVSIYSWTKMGLGSGTWEEGGDPSAPGAVSITPPQQQLHVTDAWGSFQLSSLTALPFRPGRKIQVMHLGFIPHHPHSS